MQNMGKPKTKLREKVHDRVVLYTMAVMNEIGEKQTTKRLPRKRLLPEVHIPVGLALAHRLSKVVGERTGSTC